METHPFLICPPLHSDCQTDTRIFTHVHTHRHWGALKVKKEKGKYLQGKVWSGPRMSWLILSSCTQFNYDFKASWTASECPQLTCLWSDMVRLEYSFTHWTEFKVYGAASSIYAALDLQLHSVLSFIMSLICSHSCTQTNSYTCTHTILFAYRRIDKTHKFYPTNPFSHVHTFIHTQTFTEYTFVQSMRTRAHT